MGQAVGSLGELHDLDPRLIKNDCPLKDIHGRGVHPRAQIGVSAPVALPLITAAAVSLVSRAACSRSSSGRAPTALVHSRAANAVSMGQPSASSNAIKRGARRRAAQVRKRSGRSQKGSNDGSRGLGHGLKLEGGRRGWKCRRSRRGAAGQRGSGAAGQRGSGAAGQRGGRGRRGRRVMLTLPRLCLTLKPSRGQF